MLLEFSVVQNPQDAKILNIFLTGGWTITSNGEPCRMPLYKRHNPLRDRPYVANSRHRTHPRANTPWSTLGTTGAPHVGARSPSLSTCATAYCHDSVAHLRLRGRGWAHYPIQTRIQKVQRVFVPFVYMD